MKISVPPYAERDGFLSPNLKTINLKLKKVFKSSPFEIELKARPKTRAAGILWKLDFELFLREKSLYGQTFQDKFIMQSYHCYAFHKSDFTCNCAYVKV